MRLDLEKDFVLSICTGSLLPGGAWCWLYIASSGECLGRKQPHRDRPLFRRHHFYLGPEGNAFIASLLDNPSLWKIRSAHSGYVDGDFIQIELRRGTHSHAIVRRNSPEPEVEEFVRNVNAVLPPDLQIHYNALDSPELRNVTL